MIERFMRQSFLGKNGQKNIERAVVGVVGLGGGGSHYVQQLAHIGFLNYVLFDHDVIEDSNLNRLVGGTEEDVKNAAQKLDIARRVILAVRGNANIQAFPERWQARPEKLRICDVVLGAADSFAERRELEACCRRYLIPYVDIGMDINQVGLEPPYVSGQVILSMPRGPCMYCLNFLNDRNLAREAEKYGVAGDRPQVVWPNGVLASTAIGIVVDMLTNWTGNRALPIHLSYRGNDGTITPHPLLKYHLQAGPCTHYPLTEVGDPVFKVL